jgi:nicotinate-nucleotide adenylyltransferase
VKTGVFGGTFDPIHQGHIEVAEEAKVRLDLAEVIFMLAGQPWLKQNNLISAAGHRVQMVHLAIAGKPHLKLSSMEIERTGPTYTVDTITELKAELGSQELFFILGMDNLTQLPRWREPGRLITMCRIVAVPRPGYSSPDLDALEAAIPGLKQRLILLNKPVVDIDSTDIRERVARGLSIDHIVPEPVAEYIKQHRLYLSS